MIDPELCKEVAEAAIRLAHLKVSHDAVEAETEDLLAPATKWFVKACIRHEITEAIQRIAKAHHSDMLKRSRNRN